MFKMSRSSENDKLVTKQDNIYRQALHLRKKKLKSITQILLYLVWLNLTHRLI
jgi:hypothetical protein